MSGLKYYITDVETTGLSQKLQEITEISIIRCDDRIQLTEFIKCEYPERASYDALKITGKTLADIVKGANKEDVIEKVDKFISEDGLTCAHRCFIGHNVGFDRKFIHALYEKVNKECPVDLWLDTMALTKEFLKKADESKLKITKTATGRISTALHACCDMLEIKKISQAHASKVDSRNTYLLWKKLIDNGIDYLPHIKSFPHKPAASVLDALEDLSDV